MKYELGEVTIKPVQKNYSDEYISIKKINKYNQQEVAGALQTLSGLNYMAIGSKNEAMVTVRGFDLRQVPVYLDGGPVYTIYDGYVDLSRFTSFDIAGITNLEKIAACRVAVCTILFAPADTAGCPNVNAVPRRHHL